MPIPFAESDLEHEIRRALGVEIKVSIVDRQDESEKLSPGERGRVEAIQSEKRRDEWLKGRVALKRVLARLGLDSDTSAIIFPNPRVSLTHSAGVAVAAGDASGTLSGIGIDLALHRTINRNAARFFLTESETEWLAKRGYDPDAMLSLWTVKESLYKANPANKGTVLADYVLADPASPQGSASIAGSPKLRMRYAAIAIEGGFISAACTTIS